MFKVNNKQLLKEVTLMDNDLKKTANILVVFALRLFVKYFATEYESSVHVKNTLMYTFHNFKDIFSLINTTHYASLNSYILICFKDEGK